MRRARWIGCWCSSLRPPLLIFPGTSRLSAPPDKDCFPTLSPSSPHPKFHFRCQRYEIRAVDCRFFLQVVCVRAREEGPLAWKGLKRYKKPLIRRFTSFLLTTTSPSSPSLSLSLLFSFRRPLPRRTLAPVVVVARPPPPPPACPPISLAATHASQVQNLSINSANQYDPLPALDKRALEFHNLPSSHHFLSIVASTWSTLQ